jgi:hypothetical protein
MNTWYINKCPFCNSYSVCFYYKNGGFLTVDCGREEIYIISSNINEVTIQPGI